MKKYQLQTAHYRDLVRACRAELKVLGYRPATGQLTGVREFLQRMEMVGKTKLGLIDAGDLKAHYAYLRERASGRGQALSAHTIQGYLFDLKLFFAYAERHELMAKNPMSGLRFSRPKYEPRYVCSRAEIERLYEACKDERDRALVHLLYGCGLRRMEVSALNLGDLDYRRQLLFVRSGKGRKRRVVPLHEVLVLDFRRWLHFGRTGLVNHKSGQAFLLNNRGSRLQKSTLSKHFKAIVIRAKVDDRISPHVLRHSIATHLLQSGMRIEQVRDFLGHKQLETTQRYTRVQTEKL
ncbi:MAG: tyrosine-type recombinase/integrase [Bacteroidota bacterium]